MEHTPINIVEAFFVVLLVFLVEIVELLLTFIPVVGTIGSIFVNMLTWFFIHIWLILKGARWDYFAVAGVIEFLPLVSGFFTKTIVLIATIVLHNNPTASSAARTFVKKGGGVKRSPTSPQSHSPESL